MTAEKRPSTLLLWATIVAAPAALGFETALRLLFFPAEFDLIREFLREYLTPVAWVLVLVTALGAAIGLGLQRALAQKRVSRFPPDAPLSARYAAVTGVFLLTTAAPQLPSILATFCFMFGSSILPVLVCISVTTMGVVLQALRVPALAEA